MPPNTPFEDSLIMRRKLEEHELSSFDVATVAMLLHAVSSVIPATIKNWPTVLDIYGVMPSFFTGVEPGQSASVLLDIQALKCTYEEGTVPLQSVPIVQNPRSLYYELQLQLPTDSSITDSPDDDEQLRDHILTAIGGYPGVDDPMEVKKLEFLKRKDVYACLA